MVLPLHAHCFRVRVVTTTCQTLPIFYREMIEWIGYLTEKSMGQANPRIPLRGWMAPQFPVSRVRAQPLRLIRATGNRRRRGDNSTRPGDS
jgi:hypothetical protein